MPSRRAPKLSDRFVQIVNTEWAPTETHKPRARRTQPVVSEWDDALIALARESHPWVKWWWGERTMDEGHGAFCYVCDTLITIWAKRSPISKRATNAVTLHRAEHYLDAAAYMTKAARHG